MADYALEVLRDGLGDSLHYFSELDSTNERALLMGRQGAEDGAIILAERQLAGRGRRGAGWFCGEGSGLAFSMILRPKYERALWPRLSLVAGIAVAKSIETAGLAPEIKWPNDVLINGRKGCGILVEAAENFVVVGVGLNVGKAQLPPGLQAIATSLEEEGAHSLAREGYLLGIAQALPVLSQMVNDRFEDLLEMVRSRCALTGKEIAFLVGQDRHQGFCQGIGEGGDLLVREGGKTKKYIAADQIRVIS